MLVVATKAATINAPRYANEPVDYHVDDEALRLILGPSQWTNLNIKLGSQPRKDPATTTRSNKVTVDNERKQSRNQAPFNAPSTKSSLEINCSQPIRAQRGTTIKSAVEHHHTVADKVLFFFPVLDTFRPARALSQSSPCWLRIH